MTDWKLQGSLPPMNDKEWEIEFNIYKKYPEWQQRKNMTVDEFKYIYFWEYGHRMMGRFLGFAFAGPFLYFAGRGMIPTTLYPRLATLFGMGGAQGLVGWWMVKSGLDMDPEQKKEIRVSPYRLATHLSMAFATYTLLLWTGIYKYFFCIFISYFNSYFLIKIGLDLLNPASKMKEIATKMPSEALKYSLKSRKFAIINGILVATTVVSGAFVAGNDAGNAYNTFPKMGDDWIPNEILNLKPIWKNFLENTATVQFDHRILALTTLTSIWGMYGVAKTANMGMFWKSLPQASKFGFNAVAGMSVAQVGLGIGTLLLYVPIPLAAVHQFGSLTLLTFITYLVHTLNFSKYARLIGVASSIPKVVKKII